MHTRFILGNLALSPGDPGFFFWCGDKRVNRWIIPWGKAGKRADHAFIKKSTNRPFLRRACLVFPQEPWITAYLQTESLYLYRAVSSYTRILLLPMSPLFFFFSSYRGKDRWARSNNQKWSRKKSKEVG